ncbi:hypothetical protein QTI17_34515 [Variovorax sp. J31P179]|uniref:hypothetical protein n=1 Tax=Variovorax sp. J31P179 TaxID=3053508 RepID=UPI002575CFA2|nr:hypothetical protein [Variovorax sp. J31P179]MDM0085706.1 hypothetical protein [Variovorax sp. J31P179]
MIVDDEDHAIALAWIAALHIGSFADVSLRSVSISIVDEHGEDCHEAKTAAQPAAIGASKLNWTDALCSHFASACCRT